MGSHVEFDKAATERSIPERFVEQARKYPGRTAISTRTHSLTYRELNQNANCLAGALLRRRGRGQEPVALLLEQGASAILAMLGVLKAGKFYVPLDAAYPRARIEYILEDSQASLLVTNDRNLSLGRQLATRHRCQLLNVDELDATSSVVEPEAAISPDSLAWILYTSGSTGQPKGVVQTHRNVLHDIMNYSNGFHICQADRLVLLTSCSVVDTVRTLYGALLNGAALCPLDVKQEGLSALADWLDEQQVTIYRSFSTLFRHFIGALDGERQFPTLRLLYLCGEPVYRRDFELYKRRFSSDCIFVNGMGSTECLTHRWYLMDKESHVNNTNVPVGYPLEDIEILLLDDNGKKVPFNEIGEISVKSRYLSPGYWRRPELTEATFSADPGGGDERTFRTGDLGLLLDDGCLLHMGRKDFQVKIRGYRIEVGEIEAALLNIDNIREAVVLLREDRSHDKYLVAYVVSSREPAPAIATLRHALVRTLPDYMVPSAFVMLDALPLLPNGKLDRQALLRADSSGPISATPVIDRPTPVERALARIWADVLNVEDVGAHDNFLDLGGQSLAAARIVSEVAKLFQMALPIQSLFQHLTVADMATVIEDWQSERPALTKPEDTSVKPTPRSAVGSRATSRPRQTPLRVAVERPRR
jgi:amino acid adenylation domain-containing protein